MTSLWTWSSMGRSFNLAGELLLYSWPWSYKQVVDKVRIALDGKIFRLWTSWTTSNLRPLTTLNSFLECAADLVCKIVQCILTCLVLASVHLGQLTASNQRQWERQAYCLQVCFDTEGNSSDLLNLVVSEVSVVHALISDLRLGGGPVWLPLA